MKCGVVDLGSNTVRLSLYRCEGGGAVRLLDRQHMVGLAGYRQDGALTEGGILAACRALEACRALLDGLDAGEMYVFATASLRNLSNTDGVVAAIRARTGITVDVLSGGDEAALSFLGTALRCPASEGLMADIGGGSTELVTFRDGAVVAARSLPIGSLSLYKQHVSGLLPTPTERAALRDLADRAVALTRVETPGRPYLLGAGGTIQSAAALAGEAFGRGPENTFFSADESAELLRLLQGGGKEALLRIVRAAPDRVHTILPGLILLGAVLRAYGIQEVHISTTDIRDGYLRKRVLP